MLEFRLNYAQQGQLINQNQNFYFFLRNRVSKTPDIPNTNFHYFLGFLSPPPLPLPLGTLPPPLTFLLGNITHYFIQFNCSLPTLLVAGELHVEGSIVGNIETGLYQ